MSMKGYRPPRPPPPQPRMMPGAAAQTEDGEFLFNVMPSVHKLPTLAAQQQIDRLIAEGRQGPIKVPDESMDICIKLTLLMARPSPITQTGEVWPVEGPIVARFPLKQLREAWAKRKAAQTPGEQGE